MSRTSTFFTLRHQGTLSACVLALLLTGCSNSSNNNNNNNSEGLPDTTYEAQIERTEGGIPHITANDFGSLGFGTGYAMAQDNFCELARNVLRYRSQLAQNFGPGEESSSWAGPENLNSDFFYKMMLQRGIFDHTAAPELEAQFAGFAAGYNRYLRDTGAANIPDPQCRGVDWIPQMSTEDVRRFHLKPVFLPNLALLILPAAPPATVAASKAPGNVDDAPVRQLAQAPVIDTSSALFEQPTELTPPVEPLWSEAEERDMVALAEHLINPYDKGSNGVAIGRELSSNGKGLLYTNPHLGTGISFRMYPRHHIIPGALNELGANTFERANVGFGTNGDIAWTNTVATSSALMFYTIALVPGDPLSYVFDGEVRPIEPLEVSVKVKNDDGTLSNASHTFYFTHFGPMVGGQFPWLTGLAFTMRIASEEARGMQGGAIGVARSKTVRELKTSLNKSQYTAATNTIAVDNTGEVLYGDLGPVVNYTDQQLQDCLFQGPVYLGHNSDCEWNTDADSAAPGLLGASKQAFLFRTDYVANSNDSYWLPNPNEPLTGIPLIQGTRIENERTLRTRSGLDMIQRRMDGSDGLGGTTFDLDSLQQRMLSNENYAGSILRDDLVTLCEGNPSVTIAAGVPTEEDTERAIDISEACSALAEWDLHSNLESTSSHLFREFLREAHAADADNSDRSRTRRLPEMLNYSVAFDLDDPVHTPRGLDTSDNPIALQSLAVAVETLRRIGLPLNARLGDIQSVTKGDDVIPWHGGEEFEGVYNKTGFDLDEEAGGYPKQTGSGASWVMVTEFTDDGVKARGNLAYSLSTSVESPHYSDMTKLYSAKKFVDLPYKPEDVTAAALSTVQVSEGARSCQDNGWQDFTEEGFTNEDDCVEHFHQLNENRVTQYVTQ